MRYSTVSFSAGSATSVPMTNASTIPSSVPSRKFQSWACDRVRHRVAADGAERGVRHRHLAGVAEQQVERQRQRGVQEDLVEVVDPQLHRSDPPPTCGSSRPLNLAMKALDLIAR